MDLSDETEAGPSSATGQDESSNMSSQQTETEVEKGDEKVEEDVVFVENGVLEGEEEGGKEECCRIVSENELTMLDSLSKNPDVVVKSQQRGDPDLTANEKLDALKRMYCNLPVQFLSKFGRYLKEDDTACFDKLRTEGNYEVIFHLNEIKKQWSKGSREKRLKNRRYEALKKMVETTDYFSEEEMQRRNPILFEQLIGRYHTDEEREAFLQQSYKSTSGSGTTSMPLTDLFLAHLERNSEGISCRRMAQESQQEEEDEADAEYDSEGSDYDMEGSPQPGPSRGKSPQRRPTVNDEPQRVEIEDEEKELLKEEFFTTMYRSFLNGKDEDFDYSTVDDNPEYDCGENLDNDEEEKYFDDEEPCDVSDPPSSDQDDLFKPPVRSSEIESKIEQLSVNHNGSQNQNVIEQAVNSMSEDEDELDVYMKEIEKQLNK